MPKIIEIDLQDVVKNVTGLELELHDSFHVSKDTKLYRFGEEDEVHLLTDGCGGYTLIQDPESEGEKKHTGHLSDFTNNPS